MAATAWAPPTRYTSSTPARAAAARMPSLTVPSGPGGEQSTTSPTPATRAGMAVISTLDSSGARPPGTSTPGRSTSRGVDARASSRTTALEVLTKRITSLAERHAESADDPLGQGLFEVERTLGEAIRKLERFRRNSR